MDGRFIEMDELLRAGAELHFVSVWNGRYIGLAVTYRGFRHGLQRENIDECLADAKEWVAIIDHYDGTQWTPEQIAVLQQRGQPVVVNRAKP